MIKHSLNNLKRQGGRTALFLSLITLVSLFLILAVSIRTSSVGLVEDADKKFLTIAEVEYLGNNYPDRPKSDDEYEKKIKNLDIAQLENLDYVKSFEPYSRVRGYVGDYKMGDSQPYKNIAVIMFKVQSTGKNVGEISCMLLKNIYANTPLPEGISFNLDVSAFDRDNSYVLYDGRIIKKTISAVKKDHVYIGLGTLIKDYSGYVQFIPKQFKDGTSAYNEKQLGVLCGTSASVLQFYNPPLAQSGENMDYLYSQLYQMTLGTNRVGPFVDITDDRESYMCFYDDEWIAKQEKIWDEIRWPKTYSSTEGPGISWQSLLYAVLKSYDVINNSVDVVMTNNPEYQPVFHQQITNLTDGSFYNTESGSDVCLISDRMAKNLSLSVGDKLSVALHNAESCENYYDSYFYGAGFKLKKDFTIVGIYEMKRKNGDVEDIIYIPIQDTSSNEGGLSLFRTPTLPITGTTYKIGTFIIENSKAQSFKSYAESMLIPNCSVTVYDQGYTALTAPLESLKNTSLLIACVCAFAGLSIIILYAYIFITKQKQTALTMLNLGTGMKKTRLYLMSGSSVLTFLACMGGALIGYLISPLVLKLAYMWAAHSTTLDLSFSSLRTGAADKIYNLNFGASIFPIIITALCVFLVSVVVFSIFAQRTILDKNLLPQDTPQAKWRRFKCNIKHAVKTIFRNPLRSTIVPAVSLTVVMLLSVFCNIITGYDKKIDELYETKNINGNFVSLSGGVTDGLILKGSNIKKICELGYFSDIDYSFNMKYRLAGFKYSDDRNYEYPPNVDDTGYFPYDDIGLYEDNGNTSFEVESNTLKVFMRSNIVFTTSLENAPKLIASKPEHIEYLEDYNDDSFETNELICAVSEKLFNEIPANNPKLGDKLYISCAYRDGETYLFKTVLFKIAAVYSGVDSDIYVPMSTINKTCYPVGQEEEKTSGELVLKVQRFDSKVLTSEKYENLANYSSINACCFTLNSGNDVEVFRRFLNENGYSYPSHIGFIRTGIIIDDSKLQNDIAGLVKIKSYLEMIYPCIYLLIIAIAFVLSYLLVRTRKTELAVLRSMGAGKGKAFMVFFTEQLLLLLMGTLISAVVMLIVFKGFSLLQLASIGLYIVCYTIGIIIAVGIVNHMNVLQTLTAKE